MASFTAINPTRAQGKFIDPLEILQERPDGEDLYDIPTEPTVPTRRKRGASARKCRTVSLGVVWEYSDEDVGQGPMSKRRRTAPPKHANPAKKIVDNAAVFPEHRPFDSRKENVRSDTRLEISQLMTPPDSRDKSKKGKASTNKQNKKKENAPFQNTTVTKYLPSDRDEESLQIKSIINHRGWITTEDMVKGNSNLITQTTLDKLATFRYRSSIKTQADYLPPKLFENKDGGAANTMGQKQHDPSQDVKSSEPYSATYIDQSSPPKLTYNDEHSVYTQDPHNPASSLYNVEKRKEDNIFLNEVIFATQDSSPGTSAHEYLEENSPTLVITPMLESKSQQVIRRARSCKDLKAVTSNENRVSENLAGSDERELPTRQACKHGPPRQLNAVQIEQSDVGNFESIPKNAINGYNPEEFDKDLDDSEFLQMVSDAAVCQTNAGSSGHIDLTGLNDKRKLNAPANLPASSTMLETSSKTLQARHISLPNSSPKFSICEDNQLALPQILDSITDDDFPIDEADEEEIWKLSEAPGGFIEKPQAPESVQLDFANNPTSGEVFDSSLQFSSVNPGNSYGSPRKLVGDITDSHSCHEPLAHQRDSDQTLSGEVAWDSAHSHKPTQNQEILMLPPPRPLRKHMASIMNQRQHPSSQIRQVETSQSQTRYSNPPNATSLAYSVIDDSHEYQPLSPFARPDFPTLVRDRSPIIGISTHTFLRVCFRIGEMLKEGARCEALKQDATIELFARVLSSSREPGTTKQHFQFADLWHDHPPFPSGILANCKLSELANRESKAFVGAEEGKMARCLGRLKRESKSAAGWTLHLINIRETDWEEIRWTKRIVSADQVNAEKV